MNSLPQLFSTTKLAAGGHAWDSVQGLYLRYSIQQGGLSGVLEQWQDIHTGRYLHQHRLGITSGSEGFDGALPWSQDAAGYPRREENGDAQEAAVNTAYRTCLAWWYSERWLAKTEYVELVDSDDTNSHVVRLMPEGGRSFEIWIDVATALIVRTVERAAFETVTYSFSDYRLVAGVRIPFHVRMSNGHTRYDRVCELQQVEVNPASLEARFHMPSTPPPDFRIIDDMNCVELPFRQASNLIIVDVSVNGRNHLPFILDTGGVNLVTPEAALELDLEPEGAFWGFGGGTETVDMRVAAVSSIEFGGVRLSQQVVYVYPFPGLKEALGIAKLGGILGYGVFRRFVVQVDYQRQILTLTRPMNFVYSGGNIVPFKFNSNIPEVEGELDGVSGKFDLDTGNTGTLILNTPFVERNGLAAKYAATELHMGEGAGGGQISFLIGHASRLSLGSVEVDDLPIALALHRSGALSNPYAAGLVGAQVFQRFVTTFDYSRQQVIFAGLTDG